MKTKMFIALAFVSFSLATYAQKPIDAVIAKFNEGAALVNSGDFKNAISDFEEVITLAEKVGAEGNDLKSKAQTQIPVLNYQVANSFIKMKKYDEAIPYLEKTIESADLYNNNSDSKAKALKYLPALLTSVGSQKFKDDDLPGALSSFDEALKYDPSYAKAFLGKGLVYADQSKLKEMTENFNKAIEIAKAAGDIKTVETAQKRFGAYYIKMGNLDLSEVDAEDPDYSAAIASFEKAISFDPAAADAYYMLAVIYNKENEYDKALENCNKALISETDATKIAAINLEVGNALFGNADYKGACEALNKALVGPIAEKASAKKEKVPGCE